jgi:hypothetical protein
MNFNHMRDLIVEASRVIGEIPPHVFPLEYSLHDKIKAAARDLQRASRVNDRTLALVYAFHLGALMSEAGLEGSGNRSNLVSSYFGTMARYVFDIFEHNPGSLLVLPQITIQDIKLLRRRQVLELRALIFAGAQN